MKLLAYIILGIALYFIISITFKVIDILVKKIKGKEEKPDIKEIFRQGEVDDEKGDEN